MHAWKITVHTVYLEASREIISDTYTMTTQSVDNIPGTLAACLASAVSDGDTIVSVSIVPVTPNF